MHVADGDMAMVKHSPLAPVTLNRIHPDAKDKMPWLAYQQIKPFAPDGLSPPRRLVRRVEKGDAPFLLENEETSQNQRYRQQANHQNSSSACSQQEYDR